MVDYKAKDGNLSSCYLMERMPLKIAIELLVHTDYVMLNQACSHLHAALKVSLKKFFWFKLKGACDEQNEYSLTDFPLLYLVSVRSFLNTSLVDNFLKEVLLVAPQYLKFLPEIQFWRTSGMKTLHY